MKIKSNNFSPDMFLTILKFNKKYNILFEYNGVIRQFNGELKSIEEDSIIFYDPMCTAKIPYKNLRSIKFSEDSMGTDI